MKKLLGISLVAMMAVTSANAEIASKAYVDQKDTAVSNKIGTLDDLDTTAKTNVVSAINELVTKTGATSVADQIAAAVNPVKATADAALPTTTAESDYLKKADAATTYQTINNLTTELTATSDNTHYPSAKSVYDAVEAAKTAAGNSYQAKSTADFQIGTTGGVFRDMTPAEKAALGSGINSTKVGQIKINADDIAAINDATTGILKQAKDYTDTKDTAMDGRVDTLEAKADALGTAANANVSTVGVAADEAGLVTGGQVQTAITSANSTALQGLALTNAQATGSGVVTQVTQTNGQVAVTKADPLTTMNYTQQAAGVDLGDGSYSLTMKVVSGTPTYAWELIERAE